MELLRLYRSCILSLLLVISAGCYQNGLVSSPESIVDLLPIADVRQSTCYTCGVASMQAILEYYGIEEREDILAKKLGTTENDGTSPSQIIAGFQAYNLTASIQENTTLEDIAQNLQKKIPTMVAIQAWLENYPPQDWKNNWEDGHWVIVIGMDEKNIYLEDPSLLGTRGYLTKEEFLARWHDYTGDSPCCSAKNKPWNHLSISVQGTASVHSAFTHID